MDLVQPISRYVAWPLWQLKNQRKDACYLRQARLAEQLSHSALASLQLSRLKALLLHAQKRCPFYSRRFREVGLDPSTIKAVEDIQCLPLLTKRDIQQYYPLIRASGLDESDYVQNRTGGSTGAPLHFLVSRDSVYRRIANTIRHDQWAGLEPYHKAAVLWGHRSDLSTPRSTMDKIRDSLVSRRVVLDASSITDSRLREFVTRINQTRPSTFVAYANMMFLLARYVDSKGLKSVHRPRQIIVSAEFMAEEQRQLIEHVFRCPVYNRYGCREFSVIASECDRHDGMHIASDTLLVEVIRNNRLCAIGDTGQIVITDFFNYAMPFIRYRIEDMGFLVGGDCSCGRVFPRMAIVGGRVTDCLVSPEGTIVSGASLTIHLVSRVPGIVQAQLRQTSVKHLIFRLVISDQFDDNSRRLLADEVLRFLGPEMAHTIEVVDAIPPEASGKYRFSISDLDPLEHLR